MSLLDSQIALPERGLSPEVPLRLVRGIIAPLSRTKFALLCMIFAASGVMLHLVVQTQISQGAFAEQSLTSDVRTSLADVQRLQQQMSVMSASSNLSARARELGMVEMASPAFIRLSDGQILGQASVATKGEEIKTLIKALPSTEVALNGDASKVLDISQVRVDDSAVLISSSRS